MKKNTIKKRTLNELRQNKTYGYRPPVDTKEELRVKFAKAIKTLDEARQIEMEQYANQRVIDELEEVVKEINSFTATNKIEERLLNRIKELK